MTRNVPEKFRDFRETGPWALNPDSFAKAKKFSSPVLGSLSTFFEPRTTSGCELFSYLTCFLTSRRHPSFGNVHQDFLTGCRSLLKWCEILEPFSSVIILTLPRTGKNERNEEIGVKTNRRPRGSMKDFFFSLRLPFTSRSRIKAKSAPFKRS